MNHRVLTIPARVDRLKECFAFLRRGAEAAGLSASEMDQLDLLIEEVFMNIARHAYAPGVGEVELAYTVNPGTLHVEISDSGKDFNPLAGKPPDLTLSLADRSLGGMGIFLVRELADSPRYERAAGRNRLSFSFPVKKNEERMQSSGGK